MHSTYILYIRIQLVAIPNHTFYAQFTSKQSPIKANVYETLPLLCENRQSNTRAAKNVHIRRLTATPANTCTANGQKAMLRRVVTHTHVAQNLVVFLWSVSLYQLHIFRVAIRPCFRGIFCRRLDLELNKCIH